MEENEIREQRYRFFSERGVVTAHEQDKVLVTLFTAIIAGLIALVVQGKVSFWSGVFFLIADGMAVMGLASCLLHMSFTSKVMLLLAARFGGEENVPNILDFEEPTEAVLQRTKRQTQNWYASQMVYLFLSVASAGIGLGVLLWRHIMAAGLVMGSVALIITIVAVSRRIWNQEKDAS